MSTTSEPLALVSEATPHGAMYSPFCSHSVLYDRGFALRYLTPEDRPHGVPDEARPELFRTADFMLLNLSHNLDHARRHHDLCLELGRPSEKTLLISHARRPIKFDTPCPVLYFRKGTHLMDELRAFFGISGPVARSEYGYSMVFRAPSPFFALSDLLLPQALLSTLRELRFSGRCESYSNARKIFDRPDYILALAISERTSGSNLDGKWWKRLEEALCAALSAQNAGVSLVPQLTEFVQIDTIEHVNFLDGMAEFEDGRPTRLCFPQEAQTWFKRLVLTELGCQLPPLRRP